MTIMWVYVHVCAHGCRDLELIVGFVVHLFVRQDLLLALNLLRKLA